MNGLTILFLSLPEAFKTGFIYAIMVMGVYITYKILNFPDMSVDATFPLGGFVFAAFAISENGFFGITNPLLGLVLVVIAGMIAGLITGVLHVYLNINGLLSGILVMTGLYSINSRIIGVPNVFIPTERSIYGLVKYDKHFILISVLFIILLLLKGWYDYRIKQNKYVVMSMSMYTTIILLFILYVFYTKDIQLMLTVFIAFAIKMFLDYMLTSKFGFVLRALGNNEKLVISLGVNEKKLKILGLMIANGFVALSGSLFAQSLKVADLQSGVGTIVVGLAAIILGLGVLKRSNVINEVSIIIVGSLLYYTIINIALTSNNITRGIYTKLSLSDNIIRILEIKPTDTKIITALILTAILWSEKRKKVKRAKNKMKSEESK